MKPSVFSELNGEILQVTGQLSNSYKIAKL